MLFRCVNLGDRLVDLRVEGGLIAEIAHPGVLLGEPGDGVVEGGRLSPPMAEPHVHLDAALLGARKENRSGTLREGIANWAELREGLTREDVLARARETLRMYARFGTLRVRTHVDTASLVAVEALLALREALRAGDPALPGVELQVVAFPQEGILRARGNRERWEEAVRMGCDAVGAIPHFERTQEEGWASVRLAFELAARYGRQVDLHCDETDDPGSRNLEVACALKLDGADMHVVAGHCTALHSYTNPLAAKVIELVALSGVQIVANPLDNIVLQGRYDGYPRRRGVTRVDELWAAGATVGIGHDSVMDPWYRLGTANMLDPAYMLVHVGHLTGLEPMRRVFETLHSANHAPFGGAPALAVGEPATMLWWPQADPVEILRLRPAPVVWVRGERVEVSGKLSPEPPA